jgi:predicted nucleic acid-binding protein
MAGFFFDTSALGKNYHSEVGSAVVDQLLKERGARHFISRLALIEIQSVFAGKVRTGTIGTADFQLLRRRFLTDVTHRQFLVVRMTGHHYDEAERLIRKYGASQRLRTLDALQLAVALDLKERGALDVFVCADRGLLPVAEAEGFSVINPEQP